jgi:hypothetical protein
MLMNYQPTCEPQVWVKKIHSEPIGQEGVEYNTELPADL